ncbi:hypothetical protein BGZ67_009325 [Mortierella alpina]|nr:hypothetical protein BGZ67_009325 [Mortierella alpina]
MPVEDLRVRLKGQAEFSFEDNQNRDPYTSPMMGVMMRASVADASTRCRCQGLDVVIAQQFEEPTVAQRDAFPWFLKSAAGLRVHKTEAHDGPRRRIHPLRCLWCPKDFQSRKGLERHLLSCGGVKKLSFPQACPSCELALLNPEALSNHSLKCHLWPEDVKSQEEGLEGGEKMFGLLLAGGAKRLGDGSVAYVRPLKHRLDDEIEDLELKIALKAHAFSLLVDVENYEPLGEDDPLCFMPFSEHNKLLSRKLVGLLIQSGDAVLLCLKVEVYGRSKSEDPHALDLALPDGISPFKVVNQLHESTSKVMGGTVRWNALVTMAVVVTNGKVVVGPHNTEFHPHPASHVWLRKDGGKDMFNNVERQTRSKFHKTTSFELLAAAHPRFLRHCTLPVTLKTLWEFKATLAWSGIKVASFVFHQLFTCGKISKSDVTENLQKLKADKDTGIIGNLNQLVEAMQDEETSPVSEPVSKQLMELAGRLQGDVTEINKTTITDGVVKVIEGMIQGKQNKK